MKAELWKKIDELFAAAQAQPADRRAAFLDRACGGDLELRAEVQSLLRAAGSADSFLEYSPAAAALQDPSALEPSTITLSSRGPPSGRSSGLAPGDILLSRFEIVRFIARGGMGEVYEAHDRALGERIALKTIRPDIASVHGVIERFKTEVSRARAIASDYVCRVYELFTYPNSDGSELNFFTMQLLVGESLADRLRDHGRLEPGEALLLTKELALGLDAAHQKHIVHGDLKSGNIMLVSREDGAPSAVITDFGLARRLRAGDSGAKPVAYGGTPVYMASEQLEGEPATPASDIFSLGVVAFEMVTGTLPFQELSGEKRASKRSTVQFASPRSLMPELPRLWDKVLRRCLAPEPERRYASAGALVDALERAATRRRTLLRAGAAVLGILLALAVCLRFAVFRPWRAPAAAPEKSLAILPFEELGAPPGAQYFADGFTGELTNALDRTDLHVVGTESSLLFRGVRASPREIGQKLNVRYLLFGTIRRSGGQLRAIARLINAVDGAQLWSQAFSGAEQDLLEIQKAVAQQVSIALQVKLDSSSPENAPPPNADARDLYWLGRSLWRQRSDSSVRRSLDYFAQAIARDPGYAQPYAGLADSYCVLAENNVLPPAEALAKAQAAALRAIAIDSKLADAYVSLGQVTSLYDRDFERAERYFKRALELNRNSAPAHQWYSYLLVKQRRFAEAMSHAQTALTIEPLSVPANINLALQYFYVGNYDAAEQQCQKADQLQPTLIFTHAMPALMEARKGRFDKAYRHLQKARQRGANNGIVLRVTGEVHALAGHTKEAEEAAQTLIAQRPAGGIPASYAAIVYATLGQREMAFAWLEKAYAEYDGFLSMLDVYPAFETLRSDPRYEDLMRRLGLKGRKESDSTPPR